MEHEPAATLCYPPPQMAKTLRNTFNWSVSRDSTFLECPRKYFFQYYGFWGGWEQDATERVRETYILKQLLALPLWIGQVVHDCIRRSLENLARRIPVLPVDEILTITRNRMRQDFRQSRAGAYRKDPKAHCGLFEHEYALDVPERKWREAAEQVDRCLRNFYESATYERLRRLPPEDFLEIERFSSFRLDESEILIKLDCATRESDRIVVWDWKTGRAEQTGLSFQMACYAYYASHNYRVPVRHVVTRRFELFRGELHDDSISEGSLEELLSYIRGSITDMKALLEDRDRNLAREERFSKVEKADICLRCNFLKVCKPNI